MATGTREDPWVLKTAPGSSEYTMYRDEEAEPAVLVCQVGSTKLTYDLRAIEDLHRRCEAAGRDPASVSLGLSGLWPMLDIRPGWDADAIAEAARAAASIGVGTLFTTICGDDPSAANETLAAFGEQVVAAVAGISTISTTRSSS